MAIFQNNFRAEEEKVLKVSIFIHRHTKSGGVLCNTLRIVWVSVRSSVSASFPDSNLSSFWQIFSKLCMDIDIREEWFGIANGLNSFLNNRVMALDWCKNFYVFFLNIFRTNGWILIWPLIDVRILFIITILWINLLISIKFCICIYIDKM